MWGSATQAYREALLGTVLVRMQKRDVDLTLPYVKHGPNAYNAREVDQSVVNPFLKEKQIPSSGGPFLSALRRGIKFVPATAGGILDQGAFTAFLGLIAHVAKINSQADLERVLVRFLTAFLELREGANIAIAKVARLNMQQYYHLLTGLLDMKSGGQLPVFIVVAMLRAIKGALNLPWDITFQGINQPDLPGAQPGDITVKVNGTLFFVAEVTERVIEKTRVVTTFTQKIAPAGVKDYIFFVNFKTARPDAEAMKQAQQYFAQGHDVIFADIKEWALMALTTFGRGARDLFIAEMAALLEGEDVKKHLKIGWNELIQKLTTV